MCGRGKLPTWLERRGYSRRLKRTFARRQVRRRSDRDDAPASGNSLFGGNVVPFPIRVRPTCGGDAKT